ncbi:MAG TPA: peptidylprolyl isomerase [Pyrinomonadaceae bacterium]|nr:peptidylprolyl isomerase [Pyrinomonadaceae bacterium]
MRMIFLSLLVAALSLAASSQTPPEKEPAKANSRPAEQQKKAEPFDGADAATMAKQCVTLDTEAGVIVAEMYPEHAPESVRSFLNIVALGYLNTTTFSRVVPGFVIQGGNFWTREGGIMFEIGSRGRRVLPDEPNRVLHTRGILSMARGEEANTATTNFFILVGDAPHLDGSFAAFGKVIKGMDVVDAINGAKLEGEKPEKPVRIKTATVSPCSSGS